MGVIPARVRGTIVQATLGGNTYTLGGVGDITQNTTEATTDSAEDVSGNVITTVSARPPSSYTVALINYLPHLPEWAAFKVALGSGNDVAFSFRSPETELLNNAGLRVAIATTGVATITATGGEMLPDLTSATYGRGMAFRIGTNYHQVTSISLEGVATVSPAPDTAIEASAFSLVIPSSVVMGSGQLSDFADFGTRTAGGLISSTFTIQPAADFGSAVLQVPPADFNFNA